MKKIGQFQTRDWGMVDVFAGTYVSADGPLAIQLTDPETGEPIARLSVNMDGFSEKLPKNCFYMKDWSENERIAADALYSGLFRPVDYPWVEGPWTTARAYKVLVPIE